jgi:hypothetical protein
MKQISASIIPVMEKTKIKEKQPAKYQFVLNIILPFSRKTFPSELA